ncbi:hypothetical protein [Streptomyces sp. KS_5]|uniref:hypothetical protein n=1 Tax=Streptomyces sp. KS_5 TaxID=1881018 RepID=UPI000B882852|nr:hypothetical protein [Streptomyces sp. KS_5]
MTEFLPLALVAHGGLKQWLAFTQLRVDCSVGGTSWPSDGVLARTVATMDTRSQNGTYDPFGQAGHRSRFTPDWVEIADDGGVLAEHEDP